MATVRNTILLQDKMSPILGTVIRSLNSTINAMSSVDKASNSAFKQARADIKQADVALDNFNKELKDIPEESGKAKSSLGLLSNPIVKAVALVYALKTAITSITKVTDISDTFTQTIARINLMNDGLRTTAEVQDMILASANRSRAAFSDTADSVARMGILAQDSFNSTAEIVAFTELLNKSFVVGGAGIQEQTSAMYQLSQAMAAGKLQGDEFRSIMENAPLVASAIADYMGKTKGELKEMSSEGLITADIIKNALFGAADEINSNFETMPLTFGSQMQKIKNMSIEAFQPLLERINDIANSEKFQTFVDNTIELLYSLSSVAIEVLDSMTTGLNYVIDNWSTIGPIIQGVATTLGILMIVMGLWKIALVVVAAKQWLLNIAMTANPIGVIIMAIAVLVAALIGLGVWLTKLWQTNLDFRFAIISIWNGVLGFFDKVPLFFAKIGNGILDAFGWMKVQMATLFDSIINIVIDDINELIDYLNEIPGVSIDAIDNVAMAAETAAVEEANAQARDNALAEKEAEIQAKIDARQNEFQLYVDNALAEQYANAQSDAEVAAGEDEFDWSQFGNPDGGSLDEIGEVGSIKDDVSITEEDIKLLKDVAAVEFVNQYTTLRPELYAQFGDVRETADVNELLTHMEDLIEQAYASKLVGVEG